MKLFPVYLFSGPEIGQKADQIEALKAEFSKSAQVETSKYYIQDKTVEELISELLNGSLFGDKRFIIYSGVDALTKKADLEPLLNYCKKPSEDVLLILVTDETQVDASLKSALDKDAQKVFWELDESKKEQWIVSFFRKNEISIDPGAVEALLSLVENNTEALKTEATRLAEYFKKVGNIREEDVDKYVSHNKQEDAFTLFEKMVSGTLEEALETLQKILYSKDQDPIGVLAGLSWSFKRLGSYHSLKQYFGDDSALLKLGIRAKSIQAQYRNGGKRYNMQTVEQIIAKLVETDISLRSGGSFTGTEILKLTIYSIMKKDGNPLSCLEKNKL